MDEPPVRRGLLRRLIVRTILGLALATWGGVALWHANKPLPPGVHVDSAWIAALDGDVAFMHDVTTADAYGRPIMEQQIFDETLRVVQQARDFIVLDYFLFNAHRGTSASGEPFRAVTGELASALIQRKQALSSLQILFITDPINDVYGGEPSPELAALRAAGIDVVMTDLDVLRDSNPTWSALWRLTLRPLAAGTPGSFPNPVNANGRTVSPGAWARLINFKANHRKVLIADDGEGRLVGIVTSANPHDASSAHSNVGLRINGDALRPLLASELAIARFSGWRGALKTPAADPVGRDAGPVLVRTLTEGAIGAQVIAKLATCTAGDQIDIAMFYLSDRDVVDTLRDAATRGAAVRVLLDPNKDAFGRTKSGIPNRPVAAELVTASDGAIRLRWYRTHGEQFHAKLVAIRGRERFWMTLGSANLTRRNIQDYNLEANLAIETPRNSPLEESVLAWFDRLWENRAPTGVELTADYDAYADPSQLNYWGYRIIEATGWSTF